MGFTNGRNPLCLMELTKRGIKRKCFRQCLIAFFNCYMFIFIHIHIHLDDNPNSKQKHSYKCSLKTQSFRNLHGVFLLLLKQKRTTENLPRNIREKLCSKMSLNGHRIDRPHVLHWQFVVEKIPQRQTVPKKNQAPTIFGNKSRGHFEVSCQKNGLASKGSNQRFFQEKTIEISPPFVLGDLLFGQE